MAKRVKAAPRNLQCVRDRPEFSLNDVVCTERFSPTTTANIKRSGFGCQILDIAPKSFFERLGNGNARMLD